MTARRQTGAEKAVLVIREVALNLDKVGPSIDTEYQTHIDALFFEEEKEEVSIRLQDPTSKMAKKDGIDQHYDNFWARR